MATEMEGLAFDDIAEALENVVRSEPGETITIEGRFRPFQAIEVASLIVAGDPPAGVRSAIMGWAEEHDLWWCKPGKHYTDEKPCSRHEV